jgi:hypothetical protein
MRLFKPLLAAAAAVSLSLLSAQPAHAQSVSPEAPSCDRGNCWWYVKASQKSFAGTPVGVQGWYTIERPTVQGQVALGYHSLAAMSIITLKPGTSEVNDGVEVGWAVAPNVYTDEEPHLFAFSAKDGVQLQECWTPADPPASCGWERNKAAKHHLGEYLKPSYGSRVEEPFMILRQSDGNWAVYYDNDKLGHFRADHWQGKFNGGQAVSWYGEVETQRNGQPGCTQMGTGQYGSKAGSAKVGGLGYYTHDSKGYHNNWAHPRKDPRWGNAQMYNMGDHLSASWFTYGGPGGTVDSGGITHPCR